VSVFKDLGYAWVCMPASEYSCRFCHSVSATPFLANWVSANVIIHLVSCCKV